MSYSLLYPQPNTQPIEGPLHEENNVEDAQYPPPTNNPTLVQYEVTPITYVPQDSQTTFLKTEPIILTPNITGILLCGLVLLSTWLCLYFFNSHVYNTLYILEYCPLTFITMVHGVSLVILLPGLFFSKKPVKRNTYFLPWAFVGELFFVGYFCFFMLMSRETLPLTFCLQPFLITLFTWSKERVNIIGGVAIIALTASTFMLMTTSDNFKSNPLLSMLFNFLMGTMYSLYFILSIKSTSNPNIGNSQVLLIHNAFGFILSLVAALGLEVFFNHSKWIGFFSNWGVDMIWKIGLFIAIGIVYKVSVVLTLRFTNIHITAYVIQLGLIIGAITSNKDITPNNFFLNWIKSHPILIGGYCLLAFCCLYWFARILGLRPPVKSECDSVPLQSYSLNPT